MITSKTIKAFREQCDRLGVYGIIFEEDGDVYRACGSDVPDDDVIFTREALQDATKILESVNPNCGVIPGDEEERGQCVWDLIREKAWDGESDGIAYLMMRNELPRFARELSERPEQDSRLMADGIPAIAWGELREFTQSRIGRWPTLVEKKIFHQNYWS